MKNQYRSLLFCLFFLCVNLSYLTAQKKEVDTTQKVVPERKNTVQTYEKPYVILISIDGFRYDYIEQYNAKNIQKIASENVWAKNGMYPAFPSLTFPNHYTLATGLYPSKHGIVDNVFYDPERNETYRIGSESIKDGSWYKGLPLWNLAEQNGMLAASLFWVGSESEIDGMRPTYWYSYHEKFSDDDKIQIIKNWLTLPEESRPHFITLYFPEVDHAGHRFGPDAKETQDAVLYIDTAIQKLTDELNKLNLPINFILLSDHGMIQVDEEDYLYLPPIDETKFTLINSNTFARITAKNTKDIRPLYKNLKKLKSKDFQVYLANKTPKHLHFSSREDETRRIGDLILIPNGNKIFIDPNRRTPTPGKHGFDATQIPEMKAVFIAWGPNFKKNKLISSFDNVNIYPLIAEILQLQIPKEVKIDGQLSVLQEIIQSE